MRVKYQASRAVSGTRRGSCSTRWTSISCMRWSHSPPLAITGKGGVRDVHFRILVVEVGMG